MLGRPYGKTNISIAFKPWWRITIRLIFFTISVTTPHRQIRPNGGARKTPTQGLKSPDTGGGVWGVCELN